MRDRKLRQFEDLADEIPNVYDTPSSVGASGYLGLCAAEHHLQLARPPVDSTVAEKDEEKPAYVQLSFHEASEKIIRPYIFSMVDGLSLGLHVGASGILIFFPP